MHTSIYKKQLAVEALDNLSSESFRDMGVYLLSNSKSHAKLLSSMLSKDYGIDRVAKIEEIGAGITVYGFS